LEIAQDNGIYIPTLCYIENLPPYGACRLCIIKVEGMKGYPTACSTPAEKDMIIITKNEELQELRSEVVKLMLSEHPYSCLICDNKDRCEYLRLNKAKTGRKFGCFSCPNKEKCEIREIVDYLGIKDIPYELKYNNLPLLRNDPFIERDNNLCVLCGRCVRVCNELRGGGAINFLKRGPDTRVSPVYELLHLDSNCQFCGACIDTCPTGALSSKNMKWVKKLDNFTISICGFCSVGCGFNYYTIDEKLMESVPNRENPVNKGLSCVLGRFCTPSFINGKNRLKDPLLKRNNQLIPCEWDEAYAAVIENLKKFNPAEIAVLISHDLSNESTYILSRFSKEILKTSNIFTTNEGNSINIFNNLFNQHLNTSIWPRSFQKIADSEWILLINANLEITHPILVSYLKKAKSNGAKIVSLSIRDPNLSPSSRRLLDEEIYLVPEDIIAFLLLLIKNLILHGGFEEKSIENFHEFNSWVESIEVPDGILNYKNIIDNLGEKKKGIILLDHVENLSKTYSEDIIGLLLNIIILSNRQINIIPLWKGGNIEGIFQSSIDNLRSQEEIFKEIREGKIKALYLTERIADLDLLSRIDFLVLQDIFPSDNFQFANVVLPTCSFIENSGSLINSELRIQQFVKSASPFGKSKADWEIICELASQFNFDKSIEFQFLNSEEISKQMNANEPIFSASKLSNKEVTGIESTIQKASLYIPQLLEPDFKIENMPFTLDSFKYRGEKISNQIDDLKGLINFRYLKKTEIQVESEETKFQENGFEILKNTEIVPNIYEIIIRAPLIARKARPGQFIIIMKDEESERIPMTLSDWDESKGTITFYYEERGYSTKELTASKEGSYLYSVVGPLGNEIEIKDFGTVLLGGGCYGIGGIYPIAKEAKFKGNKVIVILETRNKILLYLKDKFEKVADEVIYCTSDGSLGIKGKIKDAIEYVIREGTEINRCFFIGCKLMMRDASDTIKEIGSIPTFVSLSTIMIDGTGMCGGCRFSLVQDGKEITKFTCVDGPTFDAHSINWDELMEREVQFDGPEIFIYQNHICKMLEKYKSENP